MRRKMLDVDVLFFKFFYIKNDIFCFLSLLYIFKLFLFFTFFIKKIFFIKMIIISIFNYFYFYKKIFYKMRFLSNFLIFFNKNKLLNYLRKKYLNQ